VKESMAMSGIGVIELIILGVCGLTMFGGILGAVLFVVAAQRRGHGRLVSCPQCGRNSPPSAHCPNCGTARQ
jgi:hypothetical protein